MIALLRTATYQALTVYGAIARWAPPSENDTAAYVAFVQRQTGLNPATPMNRLSDSSLQAVAGAIRTHEGWHPGQAYSRGDTSAPKWVQDLFNGTSS